MGRAATAVAVVVAVVVTVAAAGAAAVAAAARVPPGRRAAVDVHGFLLAAGWWRTPCVAAQCAVRQLGLALVGVIIPA